MSWGENNGGGKSPWGNGGFGNDNNPPKPPNIDDLIRKSKDQFGDNFGGGRTFVIAIFVALLLWLASGFYTVDPGHEGVVLRFGAYHHSTTSGLHYHLPKPFEKVIKVAIEKIHRVEVGVRSRSTSRNKTSQKQKVLKESLMLTGDENILDVSFEVQWKIKNSFGYLFNISNPMDTVKYVAESAMREVVGQALSDEALTGGKSQIEQKASDIMQSMLDSYGAGIDIVRLKLGEVEVPSAVSAAFKDVQNAKTDRESAINKAQSYRNDIIPRARGQAAQVVQEAEGYKAAVIAQAKGDASRFLAVYDQYKNAKEVTKQRLYLEAMEKVIGGSNKIIMDSTKGSNGVIPYLPLEALKNKNN